eukprot:CAMPEP_0185906836 /NCGR_PEP_ID=MMETSP0196C-20130402/5993_1 /TAXON_ID=2932 /ORGANISM="Alexandrium fundyense, Strain CCMP1719" /LENGTH=42 /DNA_ID= /DNA_START= /DNA_END= /DNA_ORIENTATION=
MIFILFAVSVDDMAGKGLSCRSVTKSAVWLEPKWLRTDGARE